MPRSIWSCAKNSYKTKSLFNTYYYSIYKASVTPWQTEVMAFDLEDKSQTMESGKGIANHQPKHVAS